MSIFTTKPPPVPAAAQQAPAPSRNETTLRETLRETARSAGIPTREEKRDAADARNDALADDQTAKALTVLRRRRSWLITKIGIDRISLTGGRFDDKIDDHAEKLFFVEQAIKSLTP
jgi:hypothetical protein